MNSVPAQALLPSLVAFVDDPDNGFPSYAYLIFFLYSLEEECAHDYWNDGTDRRNPTD